jgi:protein gp37
MSDLFHPKVPLDYIRQVIDVISATPQHTYQVLTKRSKRLAQVASSLGWPANLWMGVSVEDARYQYRIGHLQATPVVVRFISCEPLLGPLDDLSLEGIQWVIAGGESGGHARPMDPDWVRSIRDQCLEANVAFFFKQWGGRTPKARGRELDGALHDEMPQVAVA